MNVKSDPEVLCAKVAERVIRAFGGHVTYDEYDAAMLNERYFFPLHWINGWGDRVLHKKNCDKMSVFKAVELGTIVPVDGGYKIPEYPSELL